MTGVPLSHGLSHTPVGQLKRRNHAGKWLLSQAWDTRCCPTLGKSAGQTGCNCPVPLSLYKALRCGTAAQRLMEHGWQAWEAQPAAVDLRATACETVGGASPPTTPGLAALAVLVVA